MERVHISLNDELIERIDLARSEFGDSRSAFCRRALLQYLQSLEAMKMMPQILAQLPGLQESISRVEKIAQQNKDLELSKQLHLADLPEIR